MQTVEEFMRHYLARRMELLLAWDPNCATFRAKHFSEDYLAEFRKLWDEERARKRESPSVILQVEICQQSAEVITSEFGQWASEAVRHRYHLQATDAGWRIDQKCVECWSCEGSGLDWQGKGNCSSCKGVGWRNSGSSPR